MEREFGKKMGAEIWGGKEKIKNSSEPTKDKGEFLIDKVLEGINKKFSRAFSTQDRTEHKRMSQEIIDFKKKEPEKYKEFLDKAFGFSGELGFSGERGLDFSRLERLAGPEFFNDFKKVLVLNELIEVNKLKEGYNLPPKLRAIIEKSFQEGKLANKETIETLLRLNLQEGDYRFIERTIKHGNWVDVSSALGDRKSLVYETLYDNEKFKKFENSLKVLEGLFNRKIRIDFINPDDFLNILKVDASDKEKMEKLLLLKDRAKELENSYNISKISELHNLRRIGDFNERDFSKFISKETKEKIGRVGEIYGLKKFETIDELKNWVFLDEEKYKKLSSPEFVKQIENMAVSIGSSKTEIIQYLGRTNFSNLESPLIKNLSEKNLVFSQDVKEARPDPDLIFNTSISQNPSLWGRDRQSTGVKNITDFATFGRPDRQPYKGWPYVAAARNISKEDLRKNILNQVFLTQGIEGEPGLEKGKEIFNYVKTNLPHSLKPRFNKIFENLEEWRKEGKEIGREDEYGGMTLWAGAYVRFDDKLDVAQSFGGRLALPEKEYKNLYDYLDRGFKAPSQLSNLIGKGIETLYDFMTNNKEEYKKELRNLEYPLSRQKELSPEEVKIWERKSKNILNSFEIMESVYKTPRGVYLSDPPLHGGARGEEPRPWDPRTYSLRDNIFYRVGKDGKENFVNVKEYHLGIVAGFDDLKIRLYSFSEKPDPKNFGEEGLSLEIEIEDKIEGKSKTKFLEQKEAENLLKDLKEYTLVTLYLKDSPLLKIKEEK